MDDYLHLKYTFVPVNGVWTNVTSKVPKTLAEFLEEWNIVIDDKCEFARLKIYASRKGEENYSIWYRAQALKITIDINTF